MGGALGGAYRAVLDGTWASSVRSGLQRRPGYRVTPADRRAEEKQKCVGGTEQPVHAEMEASQGASTDILLCR